MSFNPIMESLDKLTMEQLTEKMSTLQSRIAYAHRTGNNNMLRQLQDVYDIYYQKFQEKSAAQLERSSQRVRDVIDDSIDIN